MAKAKQTAKATAKTRQATAAEKATKSDKGTTETPVKDLTALVEIHVSWVLQRRNRSRY